MKNRELFAKDPLSLDLLNQGVSRVTNARDPNEEKVARFELQTFVCDGQYATGLQRILRSFLAQLDQPEQAAAWVSGFYGSGKSHLVKMLRFLWTNHRFADGVAARSLVTEMPADTFSLSSAGFPPRWTICSGNWTPRPNATAVCTPLPAPWARGGCAPSGFPC